jgi:hypothetical protein
VLHTQYVVLQCKYLLPYQFWHCESDEQLGKHTRWFCEFVMHWLPEPQSAFDEHPVVHQPGEDSEPAQLPERQSFAYEHA